MTTLPTPFDSVDLLRWQMEQDLDPDLQRTKRRLSPVRVDSEYPILRSAPSIQVWMEIGLHQDEYVAEPRWGGRTGGFVYFIEALGCSRIKVGWCSTDPGLRLDSLRTGSPFPLKVLLALEGTMHTEHRLHVKWKDSRVHGEWFLKDSEVGVFVTDILDRLP